MACRWGCKSWEVASRMRWSCGRQRRLKASALGRIGGHMYDLIVIGGGIVGLSVAYHAVAAGAKTLLIERSDLGRATAAGAGILAPETSAIESDAWFRLAIAAVDYYPTLIARLQAD